MMTVPLTLMESVNAEASRITQRSPGLTTIISSLQKCHLIGSVRLEAMITIARYGRTTRPRPQRAIAMTVLFVVTIPTA